MANESYINSDSPLLFQQAYENAKKEVIKDANPVLKEHVTPYDLLVLARYILLSLLILFLILCLLDIWRPNQGFFETAKTTLPPIATLVIGFYFGRKS